MKKILILFITLTMSLSIIACSDNQPKEVKVGEEFEVDGDLVTITSIERFKDEYAAEFYGKDVDVIVITHKWTNNSDETTSWVSFSGEQVFQDGIELSDDGTPPGTILSKDMSLKDIKPGTTIEDVKSGFEPISEGPLEIEFRSYAGYIDEKTPVVIKVDYPKEYGK